MYYDAQQNSAETLKTGTTTIGAKCTDGIVLATDMRATADRLIAHKNAQKIYIIDDHIAATIAGSVADAQKIMDRISAEAKLFKIRSGKPMKVQAAARILANTLFESRVMPYLLQLIIAGVDSTGPRLFVLDFFGSLSEETYISTGSGSPVALGVLESRYNEKMSVADFVPVAVSAVKSAMARDVASGDGINVITIKSDGVNKLSKEEISKYL